MISHAVGIVVIGRNEGARLTACLASLPKGVPTVYVDSASSDDSIERARAFGVEIVAIPPEGKPSAARARNLGLEALVTGNPGLQFAQMVDGDCVLDLAWLDAAERAFAERPGVAALCGRLRERFTTRSVYDALCDDEWNVPVGPIATCGGIAMFRIGPFRDVEGFNADLMAGEEPDLCLRLGQKGWGIECIAAEMAVHDANITRFGQWWRRAKRGGFAYAEHVAIHRERAFAGWRKQLVSIFAWGLLIPIIIVAAMVIMPPGWRPAGLLGAAVLFGLQVARVSYRKYRAGSSAKFALQYGVFMLLAKFAQLAGAVSAMRRRAAGRA